MGYQVILDIIASAVIGGLLFLIILNFSARNAENKQNYRSELAAISSISNTMEIINEDFKRIGYCADQANMTDPIITYADTSQITFKTDLIPNPTSSGDGAVDLVSYKLGNLNTSTPYLKDRYLLRSTDNGVTWQTISTDVSQFRLTYYKYDVHDYNASYNTPVAGSSLDAITRVGLKISIVNTNTAYSVNKRNSANNTYYSEIKKDSVLAFKSTLSFELR